MGKGTGTAVNTPLSSSSSRIRGECFEMKWECFFASPQQLLSIPKVGSRGTFYKKSKMTPPVGLLDGKLPKPVLQPGKIQQKPSSALGCLLGRKQWRMLSNHHCAYMHYKCRVFRALPGMPDVHSSSLYFSVRVFHAVQLFMGSAPLVLGGSCCA